MPEQEHPATVLVVDDEREIADLYAAALDSEYAVQPAYGGKEALELLRHEPDVLLLDRRMPGLSGDDVLKEIRAQGVDVQVAFVSAIPPDFDLIGMEFDEYLLKPVGPRELHQTVARLLLKKEVKAKRVELRSKRLTRNVLQTEMADKQLTESTKFKELHTRIECLESEISELELELDKNPARTMTPRR